MLCCLTVLTGFSNKERGFGISLGLKLCLKILYANKSIHFQSHIAVQKILIAPLETILFNTDLSGALPLSYRKTCHKTREANKWSCTKLYCMCHLRQLLVLHPKYTAQGQPGLVLSLSEICLRPIWQGTLLIVDRFRKGLSRLPKLQRSKRSQQDLMDIIHNFAHLEVTSFDPEGFNSLEVPLSYNCHF